MAFKPPVKVTEPSLSPFAPTRNAASTGHVSQFAIDSYFLDSGISISVPSTGNSFKFPFPVSSGKFSNNLEKSTTLEIRSKDAAKSSKVIYFPTFATEESITVAPAPIPTSTRTKPATFPLLSTDTPRERRTAPKTPTDAEYKVISFISLPSGSM